MKNIEKYKDRLGHWDEAHQGYFRVDPLTDEIFYADTRRRIHLNDKNKSAFHNKKNAEENFRLSQVQSRFRRSYQALKKLYPRSQGKEEISISELEAYGFDKSAPYHTGKSKTTNRNQFWYDEYGVESVGNGMCLILKS
jgi:hypothetical protein